MNAAWVGVIGAAVGGGIAGVTAIGTSYFQLRLTREQLKAQEKEADRQRRFEGHRERREPRERAYADFLASAWRLQESLLGTSRPEGVPEGVLRPSNEELRTSVIELNRLAAAVVLQGPTSVGQEAIDVVGVCARQAVRSRDEPNAPGPSPGAVIAQRIQCFIMKAQAALEDDGRAPEINA